MAIQIKVDLIHALDLGRLMERGGKSRRHIRRRINSLTINFNELLFAQLSGKLRLLGKS
jgi:hypothetical protein